MNQSRGRCRAVHIGNGHPDDSITAIAPIDVVGERLNDFTTVRRHVVVQRIVEPGVAEIDREASRIAFIDGVIGDNWRVSEWERRY